MNQYYILGKANKELYRQASKDMLLKLITKTSNWASEKEWRSMLCNLDENNKIYADIVSGIIIDERMLDSENAKKLIALARERYWNIKVRKRNRLGTKHEYEDLATEAQ